MPRSLRFQAAGSYYHVMNRGLAHADIVFNDADYEIFLRGLREISEDYQIDIYAFCLMRNHYHLLLRTRLPNLSRAMRHFSHTLAQRVNRRMERDGPVFRGRFKSIVVASDQYLKHLVRYIHMNPVKSETTARPEEYAWSSARQYHSQKFADWIAGLEIMKFFGDTRERALDTYNAFMTSNDAPEIEHFYSRERIGAVLNEDTVWRAMENAIKTGLIQPGT